jgi:hypothetical protein
MYCTVQLYPEPSHDCKYVIIAEERIGAWFLANEQPLHFSTLTLIKQHLYNLRAFRALKIVP